ncbi:hypothetical protein [Arsukibacterium indicum]|uniref:Uncharacterized protein n=1 Tax=Arsukibacterium indicum TaxID=2848612 RepID=A0ABS6MIQ2_9GAMM|nr:hypothetical protein [Arsukibacterium indicum]MBV2128254.1 hypothetical protein [Arsukibacterium indicum]
MKNSDVDVFVIVVGHILKNAFELNKEGCFCLFHLAGIYVDSKRIYGSVIEDITAEMPQAEKAKRQH